MKMRIAFLENYIMNTVPMQTQSMINSTLSHALSSKRDQNKAEVYYQSQIRQLMQQSKRSQQMSVQDDHSINNYDIGNDSKHILSPEPSYKNITISHH